MGNTNSKSNEVTFQIEDVTKRRVLIIRVKYNNGDAIFLKSLENVTFNVTLDSLLFDL
ncbi:MAG: hypothetical protein BAJALOKI1v1_1460011 [Promethearchaeota archaeon]|nr:MAG: hypothetical protein BAJALOKI1v1_1460011 [Candidatus Lokiarchaeota archaeon]